MASQLSEEQFLCIICLDIFKNPVSIPCGHNFCLECLKRYWHTRQKSECPLCKKVFKKCEELSVNLVLKEITEKFKRSSRNKPGRKRRPRPIRQPSASDVPCDVCNGNDKMAVISCLVCKMSYCENHLTPHLNHLEMRNHKLMDPATFTSSHVCKKHNQFLIRFCEKDQLPVCMKCTRSDHKNHETITIDSKSKRIETQMKITKEEFQQMIHARIRKTEEIKNSVELSKINKDREIQTRVELFTRVMSIFQSNCDSFIAELEQKQQAAERRAEEFLKELGQEIDDLQKRCNEMQYLECTEDSLHLVESYLPLSAPLCTRDWSQITVPIDMYIGEVRRQFSELVDKCHEIEKELCADEVRKINQYAEDVTLDPVTAAGWLILSPDKKKVSVSSQQRRVPVPDDPRRFDSCVSILGEQKFTTGKRYWVVQVRDKTDWDLGVARESINRKGTITVRPDSGYWAICRRKGGNIIACISPSLILNLQETPQKVGIFLDYQEGSVSFYDAEAKTHIYTYSKCKFTEPLYPYFNPCCHDNGKNTAPLVICPLEVTFNEEPAPL